MFVVTLMVTASGSVTVSPGLPLRVNVGVSSVSVIASPTSTFATVVSVLVSA
ncbi:hypothetical protein ACFQX6_35860 [Streptosporangium lutulentum]